MHHQGQGPTVFARKVVLYCDQILVSVILPTIPAAQDGCCIQAAPQRKGPTVGGGTPSALAMAACDSTNSLQQFEVEILDGTPGHIKDKATGRCLTTKKCKRPH